MTKVKTLTHDIYIREPCPELSLLLLLTSGIYRRPELQSPKRINLNSFLRLASENKIMHHALTKLIVDNRLKMSEKTRSLLMRLKKAKDRELLKLQRTIETLDKVLKDEEFLLLNTYKSYPYVTCDVDLIVKNLKRTTKLLRSAGFALIHELLPGTHYMKKRHLIVDICDKVAWGSINVMDNNLVWQGDRKVAIGGIEARLPSIEGDILSIIAHTNFQFYQLTLCDILYVYSLAPTADWTLMATQAKKYQWLGAFFGTVSILNGLHRTLYRENSPMEKHIPLVARTEIRLPYVYSCSHAVRAFTEKGMFNITKLPSYLGDRLKKTSYGLHRAYCKVILSHIGGPWVRYGPISYA